MSPTALPLPKTPLETSRKSKTDGLEHKGQLLFTGHPLESLNNKRLKVRIRVRIRLRIRLRLRVRVRIRMRIRIRIRVRVRVRAPLV